MPGTSPSGRRVVHLTTVHQPHDNRILNKECRALAQAGIDVVLVAGSGHDEVVNGVPIRAIGRRSRAARLVASQAEAWRVVSGLEPALLHVHDPELVPMALAYGRRHGARVVYDAHEDLVAQIATKPYLADWMRPGVRGVARTLVGLADRGVDGLVAATASVASAYRTEPRVVIRNLPWLADFPAVEEEQRVASLSSHRAVYTGDLTEERGFSTMLAVAERVTRQVPDFQLVLAGRALGPCKDAVAALPPDGPVTALGLLPPTEVPAVVASAQVGLIFLKRLPNYAESLPTKVFEYMAAGVPFLATDFAAWERLFGPSDAGRFVDTDDLDATASALVDLLQNPAECERLGRNGRRAIETDFNFEAESRKLVDFTMALLDA